MTPRLYTTLGMASALPLQSISLIHISLLSLLPQGTRGDVEYITLLLRNSLWSILRCVRKVFLFSLSCITRESRYPGCLLHKKNATDGTVEKESRRPSGRRCTTSAPFDTTPICPRESNTGA